MDNSIRVIDNFLDDKEIDIIEEKLTEGDNLFEWFYFPSTTFTKKIPMPVELDEKGLVAEGFDTPQLVHCFYSITKQQTAQMSTKFKLIECLLNKLEKHDIKNVMLIRAKANVLFPTVTNIKHSTPHVDLPYVKYYYNLLYYVNDTDGDTYFFNEDKTIREQISPKRNRAVYFDGSIFHASSNPKKHDSRIVINLNLGDKDKCKNG